jgi:hypothetical protein
MFKRKTGPSPMLHVYANRFRHLALPGERFLDAGTAYNVAWAMEHGDSMNNGLLLVSETRVFHCLDYGTLTWETSRSDVFGVSVSSHPMPQTVNLHLTYFGSGGVHSQMTFYTSVPFAKSVKRRLG